MSFFSSWPFPLAVAALFVIVMARANGTYWIARAARHGAGRTRLSRLFETPGYRRAEQLVARWGAPVVTVSFLTIGIQTMVNAAAGASRMSLRRYLPAVTVGCVVWAFVYATVGAVTLNALVVVYRLSPVGFVVLLVAVVAVIGALVAVNLRRSRAEEVIDAEAADAEPADAEATDVEVDRIAGSGADADSVGDDIRG